MNRRPVRPTLASPMPNAEASQPQGPAPTIRRPVPGSPASDDAVQPCRPILRPPMAILELLDDGSDRGEEIRVRADAVTIGRLNADIKIPHDAQISGCHVRLTRQPLNGEFQWVLADLASTNGTFLRVSKAVLQPTTPFIIGSHRYAFRPAAAAAAAERSSEAAAGTKGWQAPSADEIQRQLPAIVRIVADGAGQVFPIQGPEIAIGSDPALTSITITDDPTVNGLHGHIRMTEKGRVIEDNKSLNGLWIAISERRLTSNATFQIGEQRIRFRVL